MTMESSSNSILNYKQTCCDIMRHNVAKSNTMKSEGVTNELRKKCQDKLQHYVKKVFEEKIALLHDFRDEFNVSADSWDLFLRLTDELKLLNDHNSQERIPGVFHSLYIPSYALNMIKRELIKYNVNPGRINLMVKSDQSSIEQFSSPQHLYKVDNNQYTIMHGCRPGIIELPVMPDLTEDTLRIFCQISAFSVAFSDALEWDVMAQAFPSFGISREQYFNSNTYKRALPTFSSHPILLLALSDYHVALTLLDYILKNYIPLFSIENFKMLSKIVMLYEVYFFNNDKNAS